MVDGDYIIGSGQLTDNKSSGEIKDTMEQGDLNVQVRVGWVKGLNRLYFLYEAYDNDWNMYFKRGDIFEPVVDADLSGGPYGMNPQLGKMESYFNFKGVHAQNYHIFTPPGEGRDWALIPGCNPWILESVALISDGNGCICFGGVSSYAARSADPEAGCRTVGFHCTRYGQKNRRFSRYVRGDNNLMAVGFR